MRRSPRILQALNPLRERRRPRLPMPPMRISQAHLKNGIVVAEKNERYITRRANFPDEIENARESRSGFHGALGRALNRGPSASGSLNGTPSSITSAPASARASNELSEAANEGSPAVMYGTTPISPRSAIPRSGARYESLWQEQRA